MTKPLLLVALLTTAACAHGGHQAHHGGHHHRFTDPAAMAARWDDPSRDAWQKPETPARLHRLCAASYDCGAAGDPAGVGR